MSKKVKFDIIDLILVYIMYGILTIIIIVDAILKKKKPESAIHWDDVFLIVKKEKP